MKTPQIQFTTSVFLLIVFSVLASADYSLSDNVVGRKFYNFFQWDATSDATHGRVNYVDWETAQSLNLTYASDDTFILRADYKSVVDPSGPGRNSVRIKSWKSYTKHVVVFDIRHMPQGCGTWPAIWEVKDGSWPYGGELDIVEGVNDFSPNSAVFHSTSGCTMPKSRNQTGTSTSYDCASSTGSNLGCVVKFQNETSFGPPFNRNGGGWYVMERSPNYVKIWFWARNDPSVPSEVVNGAAVVDPNTWGTPTAYFPDTTCDFPSHFWDHVIIINLTLCGEWAGAAYPKSCPSTCVDFVNNHPEAFVDAFFDFAAMRIYQ